MGKHFPLSLLTPYYERSLQEMYSEVTPNIFIQTKNKNNSNYLVDLILISLNHFLETTTVTMNYTWTHVVTDTVINIVVRQT